MARHRLGEQPHGPRARIAPSRLNVSAGVRSRAEVRRRSDLMPRGYAPQGRSRSVRGCEDMLIGLDEITRRSIPTGLAPRSPG